ncbi:MAG: chloride channel protein [Candidatus Nanopelagicales bacterium]
MKRTPVLVMLIGAVLSLFFGYIVLELVTAGIVFLWESVPQNLGGTPYWYVMGLLLIAALLVFVIRRHVGDAGHSPIGGIKVSALTPKEYFGAILAIVVSLLGGAVLGPEVALVSTGAVIGGLVARAFKVPDAKKVVGISALGAILALFVNPLISGSLSLDGAPTSVEVDQLLWAVPVALVATLMATLARYGAALITKKTGTGPHLPALLAAAVVIGVAAIVMNWWTDLPFEYIATSSEEVLTELPTLTSISVVLGIVVFKTIAYSVSMGAGFRGGPFFPVMFIGAATGLLFALLLPSGPAIQAALAIGVIASVIATAPMKWSIAIVLGAVLGFFMGGWALVPSAIIGAVVARAVPRLGDRVELKEHV